ncbi:hypothetical protein [Embleya scabrispora]|uniref:hypothetical protein n=1 Tax=Embleya scabrispora TaxID=159449 RepID=UPI001F4789C1|nr:hypothetical protein [Embleya scabrispora]
MRISGVTLACPTATPASRSARALKKPTTTRSWGTAARTLSGVGPWANSSRSTATEARSPKAVIAAEASCKPTTAMVAFRSAFQASRPIRRMIRGTRARTCPTVAVDAAPS